jgi:hypothetical protein
VPACDFFTVETLCLKTIQVLFFLSTTVSIRSCPSRQLVARSDVAPAQGGP